MESDSAHRDLSKNVFFEILSNFSGLRQKFGPFFRQIFTFGKSARIIWKIYSIPAYSDGFRTFKKSLLVAIIGSIYLLTLVVRKCIQSRFLFEPNCFRKWEIFWVHCHICRHEPTTRTTWTTTMTTTTTSESTTTTNSHRVRPAHSRQE